MAFQTTAFDLTPAEKHALIGQIRALTLSAGQEISNAVTARLQRSPRHSHIHLALGNIEKAYSAYQKAASSQTRRFTDSDTSRDEAKRLLKNWDDTVKTAQAQARSAKRESEDDDEGRVDGKPGERSTYVGPDGIALPVTLRPGPAMKPHFEEGPHGSPEADDST
ncbi:hypothetical protein F5Y08DRAFT_343983 [Xylaria arbuscula]|nr:hypothetical protein F5Y08DRAFT_343983 [Xylaria arbuscula]